MYQRYLLFVTLAGALTLAKSDAAEQVWLRAATPNFELYTTENEGAARRAILNFEQVRAFFLKSGTALRLPAGPVRVIGFRSEREFRPYSPRTGVAAYYQPSQFRECIVMRDLSDVVFPIAVHEYVHLLLHHAGAKTPPWLGEGLAEFYSTLRRGDGQSIRVGEIPLGRRASLQRFRWLELDQLFRADLGWLQSAPREQLDVFYGESWALVHMLSLSEKYQAKFPPAMDAILAGGDSETVILKALGVSLDQLRADLQAYMSRQVYRVALFPFSLEKEVEQLDVRPATSLEAAVAVTEFLAERKDKQAEARQAYEKLASDNPSSWRPEAGLARIALMSGALDDARRHFRRADELECTDARVYLDYARVGPADANLGSRAALYRKVVALLKSDDPDTLYEAGMGLYHGRDYAGAWSTLGRVKLVKAEQASEFFRALAYCARQFGDHEQAKKAAKRALDAARSPQEKDLSSQMLDYVSQAQTANSAPLVEAAAVRSEDGVAAPRLARTPAPAPTESQPVAARFPSWWANLVEGEMIQVDCAGQSAKVWLRTGDQKLAFALPEGGAVTLVRGGESVSEEWQCGPQSKPQRVAIRFDGTPDAKTGVRGIIKRIDFQ